ncbi:MAG: hypothetical protein CM1200mP9_06780 [Gammaproteobacteria bacterium]|nr:MAG: hypothetical protein CM1200mP9_06780 [Gammaproteobacteria bacterium]
MTSPYLFQPIDVGASLVVNSLTKYICGHGNALGGAITEPGQYDWSPYAHIEEVYKKGDSSKWGMTQIRKKGLRDFGAALGPEAAHHISMGSETWLFDWKSNVLALKRWPSSWITTGRFRRCIPRFKPSSHFERSAQFFKKPRCFVFVRIEPRMGPFVFLNRLKVVIKSSNLGDNRTLAIPVRKQFITRWELLKGKNGHRGVAHPNFRWDRRG